MHKLQKNRNIIFKIFIFVIVFLISLNLFNLYYELNLIYFVTNNQPINSIKQNHDYYKSSSSKPITIMNKKPCKLSNLSMNISDIILQLKEDLDAFYLSISNNSVLNTICNNFIQMSNQNINTKLISAEGHFNFINNKFIRSLKKGVITRVENAPKGSQLKLKIHFEDHSAAILKPKWYSPSDIMTGPVYGGKDRHYGEVVSFYLSILLQLPKVLPSAIRILDIKREIITKSDSSLLKTFILKDDKICFYGNCKSCNPHNAVCTNTKFLETSLSYYLPIEYNLRAINHPWHRTYRCSKLARWESNENYCTLVRHSSFYSTAQNQDLFLDLMDVAIFDFLISNGDRHHYEIISNFKKPRIILIDNGKSFGNPYVDHIDILAPLYQCCVLRNSTMKNLLELRGGGLSKWIKYLLNVADRDVQINEMHIKTFDRRLLIVFATLEYCFQKIGKKNVLVTN